MPTGTPSEFANTTTLDQSEVSVMEVLHRTSLGAVNQDYYLPVFQALDNTPTERPRWNWAASLCTLNWLIFRRLWVGALIYAGVLTALLLLLAGVLPLLFPDAFGATLALSMMAGAALLIVPGRYGNAWLFSATQVRMTLALSETSSLKDACERLAQHAPTQRQLVRQVLLNVGLAGALTGLLLMSHTGSPPANATPVAMGRLVAGDAPREAPPANPPAVPEPIASAPAVPALVAPAAPAASEPVPEPAPLPTVTLPVMPATSADGPVAYVINVGLFALPANARRVHSALKDEGLEVSTSTMNMVRGLRYRVRVGPFATLAEAEAAAQRIRGLHFEAAVAESPQAH